MATFTSKKIDIQRPASQVSAKFDDLTQLQALIDQLPEDQRSKVGDVTFQTDSININTPQVGNISFRITEHTPNLVKFEAVGSPVPVQMAINIRETAPEASQLDTAFDVQIPAMLKPMVAPHMQKAVDMLADLMAHISA